MLWPARTVMNMALPINIETWIKNEADRLRSTSLLHMPRRRLYLGKERETGNPVFFEPSVHDSMTERTIVHGDSSWINRVAFNIAAQSFLAENRTWIIFDPSYSYMGNAEPSDLAVDPLSPRAIPSEQMDVLAPGFHLRCASADEIVHDNITGSYTAPLRFIGEKALFEVLRMNQKSSSSSVMDFMMQDLVSRHPDVSMIDFIRAIENVTMDDKFPRQLAWLYDMAIMKIQQIGQFVIRENAWSPVGDALFKAISENRPRWIVISTGMGMDSVAVSTASTVLREVYKFVTILRVNKIGMNIGVLINNADAFLRKKDDSANYAIHDLIYAWGRTNRIPVILTTSNARDIPSTFVKNLGRYKEHSKT